jgi:hypothetical protein
MQQQAILRQVESIVEGKNGIRKANVCHAMGAVFYFDTLAKNNEIE